MAWHGHVTVFDTACSGGR